MSHFSLLVRLPADADPADAADLEARLGALLLPYKEAGCGADDPPGLEAYLSFCDKEDELRGQYATGRRRMLRLADGTVACPFEDRFRNPELFSPLPQYLVPADAAEFEVPFAQCYATFEEYARDHCGFDERDPRAGRFGYWKNPNQRWDYWRVGGCYTGLLLPDYHPARDRVNYEPCYFCGGTGSREEVTPLHRSAWRRQATPAGHPVIGTGCNACAATGRKLRDSSDFCPVGNWLRVRDLDWAYLEAAGLRRLESFWARWQEFVAGRRFPPDDTPRDKACDLGLIECKSAAELTGGEWAALPWDGPERPPEWRRDRFDIPRRIDRAWLVANRRANFCPLHTWARLDAGGWQERNRMRMFGDGEADDPEATARYAAGLRPWLAAGDPDAWLVIVDCHV